MMRPIEAGEGAEYKTGFIKRHTVEITCTAIAVAGTLLAGYGITNGIKLNNATNGEFARSLEEVGLSKEQYDNAQAKIPGISKQIDDAIRLHQARDTIKSILDQPENQESIDINFRTNSLHPANHEGRELVNTLAAVIGIEAALASAASGTFLHYRKKHPVRSSSTI